ncbi:MAG: SH3 domain-containing protein [Flavobacteriaceae bacterium]
MKKTALFLLLITSFGYSQNRYSETTTSSYTPLSLDEVMYVGKQKRSQYNENQKYLYALKDWIRDLSSKIDVPEFNNRLKVEYNDLVRIENQDLAIYSKYLRETEDNVKSIMNDYNYYVRSYNEKSSQNYNAKSELIENPYSKNFTGTQTVYSYSPILDKPTTGEGEKQIGMAENNTVIILEKYNNKFYKVKSGNQIGYMSAGWFKN